MMFFSPLGWLAKRLIESFSDSVIKSPLDEDFSDSPEWQMDVPEASYTTTLPLSEVSEPLIRMFQAIDGLSPEHVTKIAVRLHEIPVTKVAEYRYQVKDHGSAAELQVTMTKHPSGLIGLLFCSSSGIIESVKEAFGGTAGAVTSQT